MSLRELCITIHKKAKKNSFEKNEVLKLVAAAMRSERRRDEERRRHRVEREIMKTEMQHERVMVEAAVARADDRQRALFETNQAASGALDSYIRGRQIASHAEAAILGLCPTSGLAAPSDCRRLASREL